MIKKLADRFFVFVLGLLKQGMSPQKIVLGLSLGICLGIFPIWGATTILCFIVAQIFGLNHVMLQTINYVMSPIHLGLVLVFVRMGEKFYGVLPLPLSLSILKEEFLRNPLIFMQKFGMIGVYAITAWALVVPLLFGILYVSFNFILKRKFKNDLPS